MSPEDLRLDSLFEVYLREYRARWRLFPDVLATLEDLRSCGYRLGLLTNGNAAQQRDKLSNTDIEDKFDAICISEEIGAQKPEQASFGTLAAQLGVSTEECLFIGDNPVQDIAGARGAGMVAVQIDRSSQEPANGSHSTLSSAIASALNSR